MKLPITNFGGVAPLIDNSALPENYGQIAENAKLWSGGLDSWFKPLPLPDPLVNCGSQPPRTIYSIGGNWLSFCADIDIVQGFVPDDTSGRFYYTGDGVPKVSNLALAFSSPPYPTASHDLGVVPPVTPPLAVIGPPSGVAPPEDRVYFYTWVTDLFEESQPSRPSDVVNNVNDGQSVIISGFGIPPPHVDKIRIYRSAFDPSGAGSLILFVAEIDATDVSYDDMILALNLGEELTSTSYEPPPFNLTGLVGHPNGFLGAFVGKTWYMSEPYQAHAWPSEYRRVLDFPIVGAGVVGNSFIVMTTGFNYIITGVDPRSMSVDRISAPYPCVAKRSIKSVTEGIIYVAKEGIVQVTPSMTKLVTGDIMSPDEWAYINPRSTHAAVHHGRYFIWYDATELIPCPDRIKDRWLNDHKTGGLVFDYNDLASATDVHSRLTTLSEYASAASGHPNANPLHLVIGGVLNRWEGTCDKMTAKWMSKLFYLPYLTNWAAGRIFAEYPCTQDDVDGKMVSIQLQARDCTIFFERPVMKSNPFRLPDFPRDIDYAVIIQTSRRVKIVTLASSIDEMKG